MVANDLVDEYRLAIHPITLGKGKRLFRDDTATARFRLTSSQQTTTGVLLLTHERPTTGGQP